jgi:hypothetical protein
LGNFANDGFDDKLNNADLCTLKAYSDNKWMTWAIIVAKENLEDGCEVFVKYGKLYWLYKPNFDTLPEDQKVKCKLYYRIADEEFFDPVFEEVPIEQVPASSNDPVVVVQKRAAAAKTKK